MVCSACATINLQISKAVVKVSIYKHEREVCVSINKIMKF